MAGCSAPAARAADGAHAGAQPLAKLGAADLAADGPGQLGHEVDLAWLSVWLSRVRCQQSPESHAPLDASTAKRIERNLL
jgi:hypothetical protein